MSQKFKKSIQIKFRQADPAGILFFGNVFFLAHDCFEEFIEAAGIPWGEWFKVKDYIIPIRHTECNYLAPLKVGEKFDLVATVANIGDSSFKMKYQFKKGDTVHAEVTMVHACMNLATKQKQSLPENVRTKLSAFLETT